MKHLITIIAVAASLGTVLGTQGGCQQIAQSPLPNDLTQDFTCVEGDIAKGVTSFTQIESDCLPGQVSTLADILDLLLGGSFGAAHPDAKKALQADPAYVSAPRSATKG